MAPFFRLASIAAALLSVSMIAQASVIPAPVLTPQSSNSVLTKDAHFEHLEKREYGVITSCRVPGTVAMTFDDGPYKFTNQLLDHLKQAGVKATFFVNGHNIGDIYQYDWIVKRAYHEGHQIASHTWGHADLTTLSYDQIHNQMTHCKLFVDRWREWACIFQLVVPPSLQVRYLSILFIPFFLGALLVVAHFCVRCTSFLCLHRFLFGCFMQHFRLRFFLLFLGFIVLSACVLFIIFIIRLQCMFLEFG